jgi:hypothetical protein
MVMTAFGSEAIRRRAIDVGAEEFLRKPFTNQSLPALMGGEPLADGNL